MILFATRYICVQLVEDKTRKTAVTVVSAFDFKMCLCDLDVCVNSIWKEKIETQRAVDVYWKFVRLGKDFVCVFC